MICPIVLGRPCLGIITRPNGTGTCCIVDGKVTRTHDSLTSQVLMTLSLILSHFSVSHPQLYHHLRKWSSVIPLYLSMPWLIVNTEYSTHRVQHSLSTAYTAYRHHPKIDCLPLPASLSSLGRPCCTQFPTFPQLRVKQWIESHLLSHLPPELQPAVWPPPSTPPISLDRGLQVHLQTQSITASKCIS